MKERREKRLLDRPSLSDFEIIQTASLPTNTRLMKAAGKRASSTHIALPNGTAVEFGEGWPPCFIVECWMFANHP